MKWSTSSLFLGLALGLLPRDGQAQAYLTCCGGQPIRWAAPHDVTFRFSLDSSSPWRTPFFNALRSWNDLVGSEFDLILDPVAGPNQAFMNNAYFQGGSNPGGSLAITSTAYNICAPNAPCCQASPCAAATIVETDIIFFLNDASGNPFPWSSAMPPNITNTPGTIPNTKNFAVVAAHELGHVAGLGNVNNPQARMNNGYPGGGWGHSAISDVSSSYERLTPKAFDQANLRAMYPTTGSGFRIYAQNIQPTAGGGSSSQPLSYNPGTNNSTFYPSPGIAFVGTTVTIQTCYGNAGNAAFSSPIPYRVWLSSNNDKIDAGDTQATTTFALTGGLGAGQYGCGPISFTVPNVPVGVNYNIIYVLDIGVGTNAKQHMVVNRQLLVQ